MDERIVKREVVDSFLNDLGDVTLIFFITVLILLLLLIDFIVLFIF